MFVVPNHLCLLFVLLVAGAASADEPIRLYIPEAPPLAMNQYAGGHGMVGDVTLAALARIGKLTRIVAEPWPRAQANVTKGKDMLIIPLSRTPEREQLYTWIAPIMELERAFFSLDEPVADFARARARYRRIGVGMGTAQVGILQREGFSDEQIVQLKLGENPTHLLVLGRIDAWFTGVPEALYIWGNSPYRERNLRRSPSLASTGLYLGCSRECDEQLVEQLRRAIKELELEGISQRLQQAYLPKPQPGD
ncbi:substrate-binding periplasmic protein [Ectopseudomonas guguanensis]|uniref:substrate-binding periplasmic protein n=1 Tax=Ectopseudomonas guguanensis TaxID=1198456 RepID=UPI00285A2898|nr:transporter substrate-binding domain-containing protein [Pseudomonas guguanensis]MDR8017704.1 transporter substrate-binding domain-containing protein [Pseudomonas guguanensis]